MRFAATVAVNLLLFTNVVASPVPFHCTAAPDWKPLPFTVNVNAGAPATAVLGLMLVMCGPLTTVKFATFDVNPFDRTVTEAVPGAYQSYRARTKLLIPFVL